MKVAGLACIFASVLFGGAFIATGLLNAVTQVIFGTGLLMGGLIPGVIVIIRDNKA